MKPNVLLAMNPAAGRGNAPSVAAALAGQLKRDGCDVEIVETIADDDEQLDRRIRSAEVVVAIGGDGTLNRVTRPLILSESEERPPIVGFLGAGTANVASRAFGLPRRIGELTARVAARTSRDIDAAIVHASDRRVGTFLLWLGAGVDASLVENVHLRRGSLVGQNLTFEYMREGLRMLFNYRFGEMEVESLHGAFGGVMIANVGPLAVGSVTRVARPDDGKLDLIATRPRSKAAWIAGACLSAIHQYDRCGEVERRLITHVSLFSRQRIPVHLDGEPFGELPLSVTVKPGAIRMMC